MNLPKFLYSLVVITTVFVMHPTVARATWSNSESANTYVETRWVLIESGNVSVVTYDLTLTVSALNGTVTGAGSYLYSTTAELIASPNPGYLFSEWTGDATGSANPLSVLMDGDKTITAVFGQDTGDPDNDGLNNYNELAVYHTDPALADTDGDGFSDGYEVNHGFSPTSPTSSPDAQMVIYTAVEVRFGAGLGKTYRIESSMDLQTWTPVETGIVGTGGVVTRFYSIQEVPKRYFRSVKE